RRKVDDADRVAVAVMLDPTAFGGSGRRRHHAGKGEQRCGYQGGGAAGQSLTAGRAVPHITRTIPFLPAQAAMTSSTLYDKIWADHLVEEAADGTALLYIDRHLVHEVTSPQAFEGLRATHRTVHAPL